VAGRALSLVKAWFWGLGEGVLDAHGLARLGGAWVDAGQNERALLMLHEALQNHAHVAALHFEAGRAAQAKGLTDQARVRFAHAVDLAPNEPTYRFALGYTLHEEKQAEAAAVQYRQVLALAPDDRRVLFNLAVLERDLGRPAEALLLLERLVRVRPKDARAWYTKGVVHYERRELPAARGAFMAALRHDPKHARSLYQMGAVLLAEGQTAPALPYLHKALAQRPGFAAAHFALGRALSPTDAARAMHHLREAVLAADPVHAAHLEMARLHEHAGRLSDAAAELRAWLRHNPAEPEDAPARRHLSRLLRTLEARRGDFGGLP
jgi:tetratricopeptide (TPR) repeat protein